MMAVLTRSKDKSGSLEKTSGAPARASARLRDEAERRCLASGVLKPRGDLIRFVIGPDQSVVPDLAEKLPGHGLWVSATAESLTLAAKKNLFAKAAREPARPAADLLDQVSRLLRRRCLDFLGLAKGAGIVVLGESQTEAALRAHKIALHLHAVDAARGLDNRYHVPVCAVFSRDELGEAFGYDHIVYAGLLPHGLTEKMKSELKRLHTLTQVEKSEE